MRLKAISGGAPARRIFPAVLTPARRNLHSAAAGVPLSSDTLTARALRQAATMRLEISHLEKLARTLLKSNSRERILDEAMQRSSEDLVYKDWGIDVTNCLSSVQKISDHPGILAPYQWIRGLCSAIFSGLRDLLWRAHRPPAEQIIPDLYVRQLTFHDHPRIFRGEGFISELLQKIRKVVLELPLRYVPIHIDDAVPSFMYRQLIEQNWKENLPSGASVSFRGDIIKEGWKRLKDRPGLNLTARMYLVLGWVYEHVFLNEKARKTQYHRVILIKDAFNKPIYFRYLASYEDPTHSKEQIDFIEGQAREFNQLVETIDRLYHQARTGHRTLTVQAFTDQLAQDMIARRKRNLPQRTLVLGPSHSFPMGDLHAEALRDKLVLHAFPPRGRRVMETQDLDDAKTAFQNKIGLDPTPLNVYMTFYRGILPLDATARTFITRYFAEVTAPTVVHRKLAVIAARGGIQKIFSLTPDPRLRRAMEDARAAECEVAYLRSSKSLGAQDELAVTAQRELARALGARNTAGVLVIDDAVFDDRVVNTLRNHIAPGTGELKIVGTRPFEMGDWLTQASTSGDPLLEMLQSRDSSGEAYLNASLGAFVEALWVSAILRNKAGAGT